MNPSIPIIDGMCKDMIRNICALKGIGFVEQEVAYYKGIQHLYAGAAPTAAVAALAPAPAAAPTKKEEVLVIDPPPLAFPAVVMATLAPPPAPLTITKAENVVAAPPENRIIEVQPEKARYKRTELPDERRCTATTSRGSRCTLEREADNTLCSRHQAKLTT
jgi:hypothetical protein